MCSWLRTINFDCSMISQGTGGCSDEFSEHWERENGTLTCHKQSSSIGGKTGKKITKHTYLLYTVR